jgi:hypothetical protein
VENAGDVLLDRCLADQERLRDAVGGLAFRHRGQHVALTRAEAVKRAATLTAAEHPPDDLGVKRAAAASDPGDRIDKALDITDALFGGCQFFRVS